MIFLCVYDISIENKGDIRLRKIAKYCENVGIRIQNSVFEINCNLAEYEKIKHDLSLLIDNKLDIIRFYNLGKNISSKTDTIGKNPKIDSSSNFIL